MVPKKRIWTLRDLNGSSQSYDPPEEPKGPQNPYAKSSNTNAYEQPQIANNPLAADYCQPIDPKQSVPLYHIPNLLSDKVCEDTLKRIHQEFLPIIQRRKFNVKSISELCCCGDGLDHRPRRGRKLRKMPNNVLGYNMTRSYGRSKTHTIHLRLRNPNNHNQLFSWEDVAGTMAHELSHCVHGPHNAAFYKLMEEILEEHATLLVNRMGINPDYRAPTVGTGGTPSNVFQTTKGQTLGGMKLGNSRLVDGNSGTIGGRRLGGNQASNPRAMREAIARAAEARKRQMELTRRMMEKAKQPCVIEIYDSDDDEEDQVEAKAPPRVVRRRGQDEKQPAENKKPKVDVIDLTSPDSKPQAVETKRVSPSTDECIDLTSDVEDSIEATTIPSASVTTGTGDGWICESCTLRNRPLALVCDACLKERNA